MSSKIVEHLTIILPPILFGGLLAIVTIIPAENFGEIQFVKGILQAFVCVPLVILFGWMIGYYVAMAMETCGAPRQTEYTDVQPYRMQCPRKPPPTRTVYYWTYTRRIPKKIAFTGVQPNRTQRDYPRYPCYYLDSKANDNEDPEVRRVKTKSKDL